ncbi:MAG: Crp/Fnr family transcriptional regulator [Gammaproteobacteria bacterium]|nr:Crp/Fnr family transcriptional regulator [Gammaproteobacteria bacterium]
MIQPATTTERLSLLEALPFQEWGLHCPSLTLVKVGDKKPLYQQGELCMQVFCISKGHVKLTRSNRNGDQFITAILRAGEIFGPPLADMQGLAQETAIAKGTLQIYRMTGEDFHTCLQNNPTLAARTIQMLAQRQRFLERRLECMLYQDVRARIAAMLCEMASHYGEKCTHGMELDVHFTHQELADLVGAGRPTVSTILNELREQGLVAYGRDFICINQIERLRHLSIV